MSIAIPTTVVLSAILGVIAASGAFAGCIPTSTVPRFIYIVGFVGPGSAHPDVDGADGPSGTSNLIVIRDWVANPVPGVGVHIKFPCDINLCTSVVDGQVVDCGLGTLSGVTDAEGRFSFVAIGAAKDPGLMVPCGPPGCVAPGGRAGSTLITVDGYAGTFATCTAIALDQNGATGLPGTNGTTLGDASVLFNLAAGFLLGGSDPSLYRGRGDLNADGALSLADASLEISQFGRIVLLGGSGCPATFCSKAPCP